MYGSKLQSEAAAAGMEMGAKATRKGTESQLRMFEQAMAMQDPYRQAGLAGLETMEGAPMGFSPEDLYRLQEQGAGLQRVYSAQGKRQSGQAARGQMGLLERATADAYNRAYGGQLGAAGVGAQAAGLGAGQAQQTGQGIASAYMQGAQNQMPYIQMQGQLGAANVAALSNLGGSLANYWQAGGGAPSPGPYYPSTGETAGPGF
jgi:hypothetical protein